MTTEGRQTPTEGKTMNPSDLYHDAVELEPAWTRTGYADADIESALLIIAGHGMEDSRSGDVDAIGFHCVQVGPYVLTTDEQGFTGWTEYVGAAAAEAHMRRVDDRMAQVLGEL